MKVAVLGCGRWGVFLAWYFNKIGHEVLLWGRETSPHLKALKKDRTNGMVTLPQSVYITSELDFAIDESAVLVISIASQQLRSFMMDLAKHNLKRKTIVLCMKGLEEGTGMRLSEVASEYLPASARLAVWLGPGHVQDFLNGVPNCMVIDSENDRVKRKLVREFSSKLIRFYYGSDITGNELGAASKNVMGIAAGMLDGLNLGSLKGALMARGTCEIARLIRAMGGDPMSAYGLCHLGDYQATLFSEYSNNRRFGELWVKGVEFECLAEGVSTAKAIVKLSREHKIDLPICRSVYDIVHRKKEPGKVLSKLFIRRLKSEF
ncbi:MAG: NAD(P)H-dependent glycerol-3-phosphate dehydrogenase [Christensenellales bacterium]|jgi:glycerol-3-phosphate dehydrogenase (NAD(P)+)